MNCVILKIFCTRGDKKTWISKLTVWTKDLEKVHQISKKVADNLVKSNLVSNKCSHLKASLSEEVAEEVVAEEVAEVETAGVVAEVVELEVVEEQEGDRVVVSLKDLGKGEEFIRVQSNYFTIN